MDASGIEPELFPCIGMHCHVLRVVRVLSPKGYYVELCFGGTKLSTLATGRRLL